MATKLLTRVFKLKSVSKAGLKITAGRSSENKGYGDDRLQTDDLLLNDVGIEGGKAIGTDESKLLRYHDGSSPVVGETIKGLSGEQDVAEQGFEIKDKKDFKNPVINASSSENEEKLEATVDPPLPAQNEVKVTDSAVYKSNLDGYSTKPIESELNRSSGSGNQDAPKPFGFADLVANEKKSNLFPPRSILLESTSAIKKEDNVETPTENTDVSNKPATSIENNTSVSAHELYHTESLTGFPGDIDSIQHIQPEKQASKKSITDFNPNFVNPTPDRKLNLGRSDGKKESPPVKSFVLEKSESEEKTPNETGKDVPRKASGKLKDDLKSATISGAMPDLISRQTHSEHSNKHYDINMMQSILHSRSKDKHGDMFRLGRITEPNQHNKPFPVDAMDPRSIPGYTPALSEKPFLPKDFFKFAEPSTISSYDLVPGPTLLRTVGNIWKYIPLLGTQFVATLMYTIQAFISSYDRKLKYPNLYPYYYLLNKYGPMVRLHGPIGGDILIMAVNGQSFPLIHIKTRANKRQSLFDCLNVYRRDATPLTYMLNIPQTTNLPLSPAVKIDQYYSAIEKITDDFVKRKQFVRSYTGAKNDNVHGTELMRWAMQCTMEVYFKSKINYFDQSGGEGSKMMENFAKVTESLRLCETGIQLWRLFTTFAWLDLTENSKQLDRFIAYEVNQCINNKEERSSCVVEMLLETEELKHSDLLTPLLDLLIINVNMAATLAGFLLYNLGKTPQAQRTLFREISSVLPKGGGNINQADLAKLKYLNACIIETLRLNPPFPMLSRQLDEDTKVHGFQIPRGTFMQMVNVLTYARGDTCYEDIGRFQAERWTDKATFLGGDPLLGLPQWHSFPKFNRDLIITQVALLTAKVVREYRVEYPLSEIYPDGMILQGPTEPFKFSFIERVV